MMPTCRVLVTGGTGFIGKVLLQRLQVADGIGEIVLVTRDRTKAVKRLPSLEKISLVDADLLNLSYRDCFQRSIDVVFHLAGLKLDPTHPQPDSRYERLNHDATVALARDAAEAGVKQFILFSSTGVYGNVGEGAHNESSPCYPDNIYERTKLAAEQSLERFAATTSMAVTVLRPSNVFGPDHPGRHLLTLMRTIQRGDLILPRRDGWTNYVAVSDVADAALRLGLRTSPAAPCFRRFIANCPMRVEEFAREVAATLAVKARFLRLPNALLTGLGYTADGASSLLRRQLPVTLRKVKELSRPDYYSATQLQSELGDWPRTGIHAGLEATVRSYRKEGLI